MNLGYKIPQDYVERNFDYYLQHCSHGSTLSRLVHAHIAAKLGEADLSWELYQQALKSDFVDIQGGTTGEGIHAGVMGGTVLMAMTAYAGLDMKNEVLHINPVLPAHWRDISFRFTYRGSDYIIDVGHHEVKILPLNLRNEIRITVNGQSVLLSPEKEQIISF
jgi:trehalose/maltose hydrolase-like predicted phosphorylase